MDLHPSTAMSSPDMARMDKSNACRAVLQNGGNWRQNRMVFVGKISENDDKATKLSLVSPILFTNPCKCSDRRLPNLFGVLKLEPAKPVSHGKNGSL